VQYKASYSEMKTIAEYRRKERSLTWSHVLYI